MANPNPPIENLKPTPWRPGQSGNPAGYSKGRRQIDGLLAMIEEKGADGIINAVWLKKIAEGDFRYFKEYLDRKDGKVPTPAEEAAPEADGGHQPIKTVKIVKPPDA